MKKKVIAMLMTLSLAVSGLTACGQAGDADANQDKVANSSEPSQEESGEVTTIKVYMPLLGGGTTTDVKEVEAAVNEYIEPLINTNIELTYINYASWIQQMNLEISSGNQIDLMCTAREIPGYVKNGAMLPLDDLIAEYGSDITANVDERYINACRFGGQLYAVPTLRDLGKQQVFEYSADIASKYDLDMKDEMTMDELETELEKLRTAAPEITGVLFVNTVRPYSSWSGWDQLDNTLGVVFYDDPDCNVVNLFESEYYTKLVHRMRKWYTDGIIYQDAATADTQFGDFIVTGNLFGRFARWKPGYEQQETANYGVELKTTKIKDEKIQGPVADSSQSQFVAWAIPTTAKYPENAMKFLNMLYSDPTLINLMAYGIEGKHYVVSDEEKGFITFPEGVTAQTDTFFTNMNYAIGNEYLAYKWEGNSETLWEDLQAFNDSAISSPALGFAFDDSAVVNEVTACNNVVSKYAITLEAGCVDPDVVLPEFQQALKDAGIDKIIAEKQRQLDEWKKSNQ